MNAAVTPATGPAALPGAKPSVLVELQPCLDSYAGIPQETRLIYALLSASPDLKVGGMVNTGGGMRDFLPARLLRPDGDQDAAAANRQRQARALVDLELSLRESKARAKMLRHIRKSGWRSRLARQLYLRGRRDPGE